MKSFISLAVLATAVAAVTGDILVAQPAQKTDTLPTLAELRTMTARFAPADIRADLSTLPERERRALAKLGEAAKLMDRLFLRQSWAGNDAMLQDLARRTDELGRARLHYFLINKGPWSRLDHNRVFVPGAPPKPDAANFYPDGATKADVQKWIDALPPGQKEPATGFFSTIRRGPNGSMVAVPYNMEYQAELAHAAALLREAAELTAQPTLKTFLTARADAFLSTDYYASDVAWMEREPPTD